ncbi:hypothetical protein [Prevotella communis]|nr:hypothetical protein [Prevotella communis]
MATRPFIQPDSLHTSKRTTTTGGIISITYDSGDWKRHIKNSTR